MKQLLKRLLFKLARTRIGGWLVSWGLRHMSFLIPAERLHETTTLLAFYHPVPSHVVHILIVPKQTIRRMTAIDDSHTAFLVEVFATVKLLVEKLNLTGYSLVCNGGAYQDVPHLHFHLIAD